MRNFLIIVIAIATGVISGFVVTPARYTPPAAANVANRTLNSPFMVNDQRMAIVSYNIIIGNSATLVLGNDGQVFLETKTGAGAWTTISSGRSSVGSGLVFSGTNSISLFGVVGRGDSVRIRTNNVTGTPTYTALQGMEILIN